MASKKKRNVSKFVKQARSAAILYQTARETLPAFGDEGATRQVGYAGLTEEPGGKRAVRVKPESQKESAEAYGLDLVTVADLDLPMSLVSDDFDEVPLDIDPEFDDNRTEIRMHLGKLLDSL